MASYLFASVVQPARSELVVGGVARSDIVSEGGGEGMVRVRELTADPAVRSVIGWHARAATLKFIPR